MASYTFYIHSETGELAPLHRWRANYESTAPEVWHGKPPEECDPKLWLDDGKLQAIELFLEGKCYTTGRSFPGCRAQVEEGQPYSSEWAAKATDVDGNQYLIVWQFTITKGAEPDDPDDWEWGDLSCIHEVRLETKESQSG